MMIDLQKISGQNLNTERFTKRTLSSDDVSQIDGQGQVLWKKIVNSDGESPRRELNMSEVRIAHDFSRNNKIYFYGMGAFIVLVLAGILRMTFFRPSHSATTPAIHSVSYDSESALPGLSVATALSEQWNMPLKIKVSVLEDVWVRTKCDGNIVFEGILARGMSEQWSASEMLQMRIADPGKIRIASQEKIFLFSESELKGHLPVTLTFESNLPPTTISD